MREVFQESECIFFCALNYQFSFQSKYTETVTGDLF